MKNFILLKIKTFFRKKCTFFNETKMRELNYQVICFVIVSE